MNFLQENAKIFMTLQMPLKQDVIFCNYLCYVIEIAGISRQVMGRSTS